MLQNTLDESLKIYKKHFITIFIAAVIVALGSIFFITIPPLIFGMYVIVGRLIKKEKAEFADIFKGFDYFIVSWIMFILVGISVMFGLIFLVIPGLALMVLFQYAIPIAIKENKGTIYSLKKSAQLTTDHLPFSIMLWILITIINIIGGSVLLGLLLTYPYTAICTYIAVEKLANAKK